MSIQSSRVYENLAFSDFNNQIFVYLTGLKESIQSGDVDKSRRDIDWILQLIKKATPSEPPQVADEILSQVLTSPVKIYTLGRFEVLINGHPIIFRTKAQKRPMDLLKAIIALGKQGVSKLHLIDLLWPDLAGDGAASAVNSAIYRLRKLIGRDAIEIINGNIFLNRDYCWVDCWELSLLLDQNKFVDEASAETMSLYEELYQGQFLADDEHGWLNIFRQKLQEKLLNVYRRHVRALVNKKKYELAIKTIKKCIEINETGEEFYLILMQCQMKLNRRSDVVMTYRLCQKMLSDLLGAVPSAECQKLYLSVVG